LTCSFRMCFSVRALQFCLGLRLLFAFHFGVKLTVKELRLLNVWPRWWGIFFNYFSGYIENWYW